MASVKLFYKTLVVIALNLLLIINISSCTKQTNTNKQESSANPDTFFAGTWIAQAWESGANEEEGIRMIPDKWLEQKLIIYKDFNPDSLKIAMNNEDTLQIPALLTLKDGSGPRSGTMLAYKFGDGTVSLVMGLNPVETIYLTWKNNMLTGYHDYDGRGSTPLVLKKISSSSAKVSEASATDIEYPAYIPFKAGEGFGPLTDEQETELELDWNDEYGTSFFGLGIVEKSAIIEGILGITITIDGVKYRGASNLMSSGSSNNSLFGNGIEFWDSTSDSPKDLAGNTVFLRATGEMIRELSLYDPDKFAVLGLTGTETWNQLARMQEAFFRQEFHVMKTFINYPITINVQGKSHEVKNELDFLDQSQYFKLDNLAIEFMQANIGNAIVNQNGIGLLDGKIWLSPFNGKVQIYTWNY